LSVLGLACRVLRLRFVVLTITILLLATWGSLATAHAETAHAGVTVAVGSGFSAPVGMAVDGSGNVFVADYTNNAVKEIVAGSHGNPAGW
jgi:hypothetical protein